MDPAATVYTGSWVNWARGPILGSTITFTHTSGAYLVAFLAIFVRVVGTHVWEITCYVLFRLRTTSKPTDGLAQQHQAVLRNTGSDISSIWQIAQLAHYWRTKTTSSMRRSFGLLTVATVHLAVMTAAGVFSSRVTITTQEALVRSQHCGVWSFAKDLENVTHAEFAEDIAWFSQKTQNLQTSTSQVSSCVNGTIGGSSLCAPFGRRQLNYTTNTSIGCPFADSVCALPNGVRLDSGLIDSALDLGINSRMEDRLQFQWVVDCAPLQTQGYSEIIHANNLADVTTDLFMTDSFAETYLQSNGRYVVYEALYYGAGYELGYEPGVGLGAEVPFTKNLTLLSSNNTFTADSWSFLSGFYDLGYVNHFCCPVTSLRFFAVSEQMANDNPSIMSSFAEQAILSEFTPIADLNETSDTNIHLLILKRPAVQYTQPIHDPWFIAEVPIVNVYNDSYYQAFPGNSPSTNVLGCTESFTICNPNQPDGSQCSPAMGIDLGSISSALNFSQKQTAVANRAFLNPSAMGLTFIVGTGAGHSLLANELMYDWLSQGLPDDQWISELQNWFEIGLNMFQLQSAQYATGYTSTKSNAYVTPPDAESQWMCENQIMQRADYTSFSVLGIVLILVLGCLIILINLILRPLVHRFQPDTELNRLRRSEWDATEMLEMQRRLLKLRPNDAESEAEYEMLSDTVRKKR